MPSTVLEGYLYKTKKLESARLVGNWRKRWFLLRDLDLPGRGCLEYYATEKKKKLGDTIDLNADSEIKSLENVSANDTYKWVFQVRTSSREIYLAAPSQTDMDRWIAAICQICQLSEATPENDENREFPRRSFDEVSIYSTGTTSTLRADREDHFSTIDSRHHSNVSTLRSTRKSENPYVYLSQCVSKAPKDFPSLNSIQHRPVVKPMDLDVPTESPPPPPDAFRDEDESGNFYKAPVKIEVYGAKSVSNRAISESSLRDGEQQRYDIPKRAAFFERVEEPKSAFSSSSEFYDQIPRSSTAAKVVPKRVYERKNSLPIEPASLYDHIPNPKSIQGTLKNGWSASQFSDQNSPGGSRYSSTGQLQTYDRLPVTRPEHLKLPTVTVSDTEYTNLNGFYDRPAPTISRATSQIGRMPSVPIEEAPPTPDAPPAVDRRSKPDLSPRDFDRFPHHFQRSPNMPVKSPQGSLDIEPPSFHIRSASTGNPSPRKVTERSTSQEVLTPPLLSPSRDGRMSIGTMPRQRRTHVPSNDVDYTKVDIVPASGSRSQSPEFVRNHKVSATLPRIFATQKSRESNRNMANLPTIQSGKDIEYKLIDVEKTKALQEALRH